MDGCTRKSDDAYREAETWNQETKGGMMEKWGDKGELKDVN